MVSSNKLKIKNLYKSFSDLKVLDNISVELKKGEFVSIIGPSGCGKSTLFNIISGIEDQTRGSILIDNLPIKNRKGTTGYMPQSPSLLPWKNVLENVMLGLEIRNESKKVAKEKAEKLLKEFGLFDFAKNYPSTLSGGMKQRVALLRTVLFHNDFLLLDEPFGALDALTRTSLQIWLMDLWQKTKGSVLFITHDIAEAILLSDRIYIMSSRPAKILKLIDVNLPRPRKLEHLTGETSLKLQKELLNLLFSKTLT